MTQIATIRKNGREQLRITLEEFRGRQIINLRVWYETEDGEHRPGKQGVALRIELLPHLRSAWETAELEARSLGLLKEVAA